MELVLLQTCSAGFALNLLSERCLPLKSVWHRSKVLEKSVTGGRKRKEAKTKTIGYEIIFFVQQGDYVKLKMNAALAKAAF